jgi:hypothetical protein
MTLGSENLAFRDGSGARRGISGVGTTGRSRPAAADRADCSTKPLIKGPGFLGQEMAEPAALRYTAAHNKKLNDRTSAEDVQEHPLPATSPRVPAI